MAPGVMCFGRKQLDDGFRRNEEIEKQIRADKRRAEKEVKLLLLGAGESGKSTVLKQMRIIHSSGFSKTERKQWRVVIFHNLVDAFQILLGAMEDADIDFVIDDNLKFATWLATDPDIGIEDPLPLTAYRAFTSLWSDAGVQQAMLKGNEYALHDNLNYYFDDFKRLFEPDYIPTNQDILRTRLRTTGIKETQFALDHLTYRMFDVGGQRSERKKWIHCFDNVQVVLFLAAIGGYDQALLEDRKGNQMQEALMLFDSIVHLRHFRRAALILFFNKMDLFREKLRTGTSPISAYFPDYHGGNDDVEEGQEYFAEKFKRCVRTRQPDKVVYVHYTNATDTDLLKKTMDSVRDMIIQRNMGVLLL